MLTSRDFSCTALIIKSDDGIISVYFNLLIGFKIYFKDFFHRCFW